MTTSAPCLQLRELRLDRGWTQQEVAERLGRLAWMRHRQHVGVNADMVAKWERGAKGVSGRYRDLFCHLYGVTANQLCLAPATPTRATASDGTLVSVLDGALSLLNQLGASGAVLEPQLFALWKEHSAGRRTVLAMLDSGAETSRTGRPGAAPPTAADLDDLADRYRALYDTAQPAALLTSVVAHIRITEALNQSPTPTERRRLLANRARVAILAGRLAYDDLGNAMPARAYYSLALDAAAEAADEDLTAAALGYAAQLSAAQGQTAAALNRISTTRRGHLHPVVASWLSALEATIRADAGDIAEALDAIDNANVSLGHATTTPPLRWFDDHDAGRLAAATGHVLLCAGHHDDAHDVLGNALDSLPQSARRARVLCLLDQATVDLSYRGGDEERGLLMLRTAAELLRRSPYAIGMIKLRALRAGIADAGWCAEALQDIDEQLSRIPAA